MLLTIAVPTFNRCDCLALLLDVLRPEIAAANAAAARVELLVSSNASTDGTAAYLQAMAPIDGVRWVEQPVNRGADANMIFCMREARGRYLWIIGDDDLPLPGIVERVMQELERHRPTLLYLPARWHVGDLSNIARHAPDSAAPRQISPRRLAIAANTYVTFLSSWVVDRERYLAMPQAEPSRHEGTSLSQLEWHLPLLAAGGARIAPEPWVLARGGNSGGYSLFDTFVARYHRIVGEQLAAHPELQRILHEHLLRGYLPGLIWGMRAGDIGRFEPLDWGRVQALLASAWPGRPLRHALLRGIAAAPRPLARALLGLCWLDNAAWMTIERIRAGGQR